MAAKRYKSRIWFVLLMTGIVLIILVLISNSKALGIGGLAFFGLLILVRLVMDYTDAKANFLIYLHYLTNLLLASRN